MPVVFPGVTVVPGVFFSISSAACHSGETAGEKTTLIQMKQKNLQGLVLFGQGQN